MRSLRAMRFHLHTQLIAAFLIELIRVSFCFICLTNGYLIAICWAGEIWPGMNGDLWTLSRECMSLVHIRPFERSRFWFTKSDQSIYSVIDDHSHPDCVNKERQKCCRDFYVSSFLTLRSVRSIISLTHCDEQPYKSQPYLAPAESKRASGSGVDCIDIDPDRQCPDFLPPGYARKRKRFYPGGVEDGPSPEFNADCFYIVDDVENKLAHAGSSNPDAYQPLS